MSKGLFDYMDEIRDYYRDEYGDEDELTVEEVIKRLTGKKRPEITAGHETIQNWQVTAERNITSHRKVLGRFIVFGKKLVRKLLRWYVEPLAEDQSRFNASVVENINILQEKIDQLSIALGRLMEEKEEYKRGKER